MAAAQDLTIRRWEEAAAIARPLTPPERQALAEDITAHGVIYAVMVLPDGRIVDGHHRWELSNGQAPIQVLPAMTDQAALYLAGQLNIARRHLDRAEWESLFHSQERRAAAVAMLAVKTQAEVAEIFGVKQRSVSRWKVAAETDTIDKMSTVSGPETPNADDAAPAARRTNNYPAVRDHRKKLTDQERKDMARRYWNSEPINDVAARFNVHERTVYRVAHGKDRPLPLQAPEGAAPSTKAKPIQDDAPAERVTRSRRVYSFDTPLTAPSGASLKAWSATILSIIEFTKALRDQGVRPLVRQWSPKKLADTLANLDQMIGQIQQLRAEVAAGVLPAEPEPEEE